jgi:hypothetical protein
LIEEYNYSFFFAPVFSCLSQSFDQKKGTGEIKPDIVTDDFIPRLKQVIKDDNKNQEGFNLKVLR